MSFSWSWSAQSSPDLPVDRLAVDPHGVWDHRFQREPRAQQERGDVVVHWCDPTVQTSEVELGDPKDLLTPAIQIIGGAATVIMRSSGRVAR